ncbi:hypothetical protein [Promicromonospora iranensis]|uniref:hypothetical protein n=1 Tax=Promicromonospora iranensis TaxID=1105144 RepID=UPI0023A989DA|nr:hypothetical protein [Promicromonospora iranensis]
MPEKRVKVLLERASAAGIKAEVRRAEHVSGVRSRSYVVLQLPNGRRTRPLAVFPRDLEGLLAVEFEKYIVLGDYVAVVDKDSGAIEAQVVGPRMAGRYVRALQQLPGVETTAEGDPEPDSEDFEEATAAARRPPDENWRLTVEDEGVVIEISPASNDFQVLFPPGVTVKIRGASTSSHDAALEVLERYARALLFDFDLVYGIPVQLAKHRRGTRTRRREMPEHPPKFPRNEYAGQALELYQYGRAATGLPLLEYLAYYQSVEYFFPFFAREQTVNSVRSQLLHPGFDARNDATLNRLINLASPAGRGGIAEREQLRATVRACIDDADLREFIESSPEHTEHFCSKNQAIRGVGRIHQDPSQSDLRDQVADRIYAIRCRIVHSKQDGGGNGEEVLLPSSRETESLQADIELLRLVAQRALVARAARA